jgi:hypothetical protein
LSDLGGRSQLAFVGDVDIGSTIGTIDTSLDITSVDGQSRVGIHAGLASDAVLELQSGDNRIAEMSLISKSNGISGNDIGKWQTLCYMLAIDLSLVTRCCFITRCCIDV